MRDSMRSRPSGWLAGPWMAGCLRHWLVGSLVGKAVVQPDWQTEFDADLLAAVLCLVGWLDGQFAGWLLEPSSAWLADGLVGLVGWLVPTGETKTFPQSLLGPTDTTSVGSRA